MSDEELEQMQEIVENYKAGVYDENPWTKEDISFLLRNYPKWIGQTYNMGFEDGTGSANFDKE